MTAAGERTLYSVILAHSVLIQAILPVGDDRPCQFALTPAVGQPGSALLDDNRPYPGITVDGLFGYTAGFADSKLALPPSQETRPQMRAGHGS